MKLSEIKLEFSDYPALYSSMDLSSIKLQCRHNVLSLVQFSLLFFAAIAALFPSSTLIGVVIYAFLLISSAGLLIFTASRNLQVDWYAARALAESTKTLTWRYMMKAEPFRSSIASNQVDAEFAVLLQQLLSQNSSISKISMHANVQGQISDNMRKIRSLPIASRKEIYLSQRVNDQLDWYRQKSGALVQRRNLVIGACIAIHALAIILALYRIYDPALMQVWPIEPLLVLASLFLGWLQNRKYSALAGSYSLAAHEIGIVATRAKSASTEHELSEFVANAELAFSKEHTQWIARID